MSDNMLMKRKHYSKYVSNTIQCAFYYWCVIKLFDEFENLKFWHSKNIFVKQIFMITIFHCSIFYFITLQHNCSLNYVLCIPKTTDEKFKSKKYWSRKLKKQMKHYYSTLRKWWVRRWLWASKAFVLAILSSLCLRWLIYRIHDFFWWKLRLHCVTFLDEPFGWSGKWRRWHDKRENFAFWI